MKSEDLLDILAFESGCIYLSDLRTEANRPRLLQILADFQPERCSLRDWEEAISYLLQETAHFPDQEQARSYLSDRLRCL